MEFEKVISGIAKYIDRNICPQMNDLQEIGYRVLCSRIMQNAEKYKTLLANNPMVKTYAVMDANGDVDVDGLLVALRNSIEQKGTVKISLPLYGTFTFTPSDIDELHKTIMGG